MKKIKVALLMNLKENATHFEGMSEDQWDDLDSEKTTKSIQDAIRAGGNICEFLEGDRTLLRAIPKFKLNFLEINPLQGFSLDVSDLVIEARADGISHTKLVNMILGAHSSVIG